MKQYIGYVRLDSEVMDYCSKLLNDFSLATTMFNKFDEVWRKIHIKDRTMSKDCEGRLRNLAWLIFIIARGTLCPALTP